MTLTSHDGKPKAASSTRSTLINILKLIVGIVLIYILFQRLDDPAALWQQILDANKVLLLAGASCYTAAVALSGRSHARNSEIPPR